MGRAQGTEERAQTAVPVAPRRAQLPPHDERVQEATHDAQGQPICHAVFHEGAAVLFEEPVAVLPSREGATYLDVHETKGRVVLANEHAPAYRNPEPAHAEIEDGARLENWHRRRQERARGGR